MSTFCASTSQTTNFVTCTFLLFLVCCLPTYISPANILGFFPTFSSTTLYLHGQIAELLARSGHNVTVIGTIPNAVPNATFTYIEIKFSESEFKRLNKFQRSRRTAYWEFFSMLGNTLRMSNATFLHPQMQKWMKDAKEEDFDLLIFGYFLNDFQMGLASLYKCPIIISTTTAPTFWINRLVGNPAEATYVPSALTPYSQPMDAVNTLVNFWIVMLERAYFARVVDNENNRSFCTHFNCQNVRLWKVRQNISLVFTNHHFTQGPIRPNVPVIVEIGGIQIPEKLMPLPQEVADHINKAEKGVIYINLGRIGKCIYLPEAVLDGLFDALLESELHVLWRWTICAKTRSSPKIIYSLWMPQNEILAQKNVKLFITHGSLSSLAEGQYHAVPMLAITYLSEQVGNVQYLAQYQLARRIDVYRTNAKIIRNTLKKMLEDQSYKTRIDLYSHVYRDRPLSPRETVLYWVNYVIRYQGTPHMHSPAKEMTQLQLAGVDLVLITVLTIALIWKWRGFFWYCFTGRIILIVSKFLRKRLFGRDYEVVVQRVSNIRYDNSVVDRERECQIRPQDPDVPRIIPVSAARQRRAVGGRRR